MNGRTQYWWLIIGALVGLLVGFFVGSLRSSQSVKDATAELAIAKSYLDAGEMQNAYDALLAAMRVAPSDKNVFEVSLEFVRKASENQDEESIALAEDMYHRAADLIPFLPVTQLKEVRVAHSQAGQKLFPANEGVKPKDPFSEAETLLAAVKRADLPNFARVRLLHELEAELGSHVCRAALTMMKLEDEETFWERWKMLKERFNEAEKSVLSAQYQQDMKPRIGAWLKKVEEFYKRRENVELEKIVEANQEILGLLGEGQQISRDLMPYLEVGVEEAIKDNQGDGLDRHFSKLAKLREWNYNRWALDRLEKVEESGGSALEKLKSLAAIDESRLSPYVLQRFSEVWGKFFEKCSKDEKVEATKARILREYQI